MSGNTSGGDCSSSRFTSAPAWRSACGAAIHTCTTASSGKPSRRLRAPANCLRRPRVLRSGAGKTTFLQRFAPALERKGLSTLVVAMDKTSQCPTPASRSGTFAPQQFEIGEDYDWRGLLRDILIPLRSGQIPALCNQRDVVILEGCFSLRQGLRPCYDLTIFLESPGDSPLERAIQRDGEATRDWYTDYWKQEEDRYIQVHHPENADLVIDGSATVADNRVPLTRATALSRRLTA
jgi:hypothetical protein